MREQKEEGTTVGTPNFEWAYRGKPPWDIDRPQKEYVLLEQAGEIVGSVLDVGCGTGENALFLAARGHEVWGIDFTSTAIQKAQEKAAQRHLAATFRELNVLELRTLERTFDTVIDSGLFHTLSDEERPLFVDNLAAVIRRGGTYFMLSFSELTPRLDYGNVKDFFPNISKLKLEDYDRPVGRWADGPRRVTQAEIKELFRDGWRINYIRRATMEGRIEPGAVPAWLSSISKE